MSKIEPVASPSTNQSPAPTAKKTENPLALVSMVLGVTSLTGPGFLLGIPAIVTGIIALKKNESDHGLSITGLVTGIVSTVVSLLFCAFIVWAIIWSIDHPERAPRDTSPSSQTFKSTET
jgi:hypothetical protein